MQVLKLVQIGAKSKILNQKITSNKKNLSLGMLDNFQFDLHIYTTNILFYFLLYLFFVFFFQILTLDLNFSSSKIFSKIKKNY